MTFKCRWMFYDISRRVLLLLEEIQNLKELHQYILNKRRTLYIVTSTDLLLQI